MITTQWPQGPPEPVTDLSVWWEGAPRAAADLTRLRREVQAAVGSRPEQDDDADGLDRLLLIFEELASNGLRHGRPPVRVLLATVPTGWLLDVSDAAADRPPAPARGRDAAAGGMGLPLVARLAAAHGWTVHGDRKHVWARIDAVPLSGASTGGMASPLRAAQPTGGGAAGADRTLARIHAVTDGRAPVLGFRPSLRTTGPVADLTSDVVTDLLAVLGEALTNVARHARASSVHVDLAVTVDDVTLRVRDDGIGLAGAPRDVGLADLRRRAAWHGGTLDVQPEPAGGTRLTWAVPRRPTVPQPRPRS
jgi:two-component sensor histidine kinase